MNIDKIRIAKVEQSISKEEAINRVGQMLVDSGFVEKEYINLMQEREVIVTTYIGNHLAIPHGTSESQTLIKESGISILQAPNGIQFGEELAYLIVGIAGKDGTHMDILSRIAIACSDVNVVIEASKLSDHNQLIQLLLGDENE